MQAIYSSKKKHISASIRESTLEIGGGYGSLARIHKLLHPRMNYTIIDLPVSLFFAYIFLAMNFPSARIKWLDSDQPVNSELYDFILVPVQLCEGLKGKRFDRVLNTGSLQEMPDLTVDFWMSFIQESIDIEMFYSFNYFLNDNNLHTSFDQGRMNLICPKPDSFWKVWHFEINPSVINKDIEFRNWLEICLERDLAKIPNEEAASQRSDECYKLSFLHPIASDKWFECIWEAIIKNPKEEIFLLTILKGIDIYKRGQGALNNTYYKTNVRLFTGSRFVNAHRPTSFFPIYGEEVHYRNIIKTISQQRD